MSYLLPWVKEGRRGLVSGWGRKHGRLERGEMAQTLQTSGAANIPGVDGRSGDEPANCR